MLLVWVLCLATGAEAAAQECEFSWKPPGRTTMAAQRPHPFVV
jgi:hypothetical protein